MSDIYDRIKEIRKAKGLTQTAFGERLNVTRDVISNIEQKRVPIPKQLFLDSVVREYGVNYHWLETGEGEMFVDSSEFFLNDLSKMYDLDELDKKIIETYLKLNHDERMSLKKFLKEIFK